jgi:hypothetical protein
VKTLDKGKYDPAIREELDKANWQEISLRLLWYATSKASMLQAMGIADVDHGDLIQESICRVYGGGHNGGYRNWNKEKDPDLAVFLMSVIRSIVDHKRAHHLTFKSNYISMQDDSLSDRDLVNLSPKSPEEILNEEYDLLNLKEVIYKRVKGDEEIEMLLLCIEDGVSKPMHIAEHTGYDIKKVNNVLRRLRRKIKNLSPTT